MDIPKVYTRGVHKACRHGPILGRPSVSRDRGHPCIIPLKHLLISGLGHGEQLSRERKVREIALGFQGARW